MSVPEVRLWAILRMRPGGFRFRRQHPIGRFVIDFYCPVARLAVEIDGAGHDMGDRPQQDEQRDAWLQAQGIAVMRVAAITVMAHVEDVATAIVARAALPLHQPAAGPPTHASHGEDR